MKTRHQRMFTRVVTVRAVGFREWFVCGRHVVEGLQYLLQEHVLTNNDK